jgi:hypothetical protein
MIRMFSSHRGDGQCIKTLVGKPEGMRHLLIQI